MVLTFLALGGFQFIWGGGGGRGGSKKLHVIKLNRSFGLRKFVLLP